MNSRVRQSETAAEVQASPQRPAAAPGGLVGVAAAGNRAVARLMGEGSGALPDGFGRTHAAAIGESGPALPQGLLRDAAALLGPAVEQASLHQGPRSGEAASQAGARAYTVGRDIVLPPDAPSPDSAAGRRLLGHELGHVAQAGGAAVVAPQRIGSAHDPAEAAADRVADALTGGAAVAHVPDGAATGAVRRDPLASMPPVDAATMTNQQLLTAAGGAVSTDDPQKIAAHDEIRRRVVAGQAWLAGALTAPPAGLVSLVDNPDGTVMVVQRDTQSLLGAVGYSGPLTISQAQFDRLLAARGVTRMSFPEFIGAPAGGQAAEGEAAATEPFGPPAPQPFGPPAPGQDPGSPWLAPQVGQSAVVGGRLGVPAFGRAAEGSFAGQPHSGWIGPMGEAAYGTSRGGLTNTNTLPWMDASGNLHSPAERNFPVVDFSSHDSQVLMSVKTSLQNARARQDFYLKGFANGLGTGNNAAPLQSLIANLPPGTTQADVARALQLVITEDDVVALRTLLTSPSSPSGNRQPNWQRKPVQQVYDGVLQANAATINGNSYGSVQDLRNALQGNAITQAQFDQALFAAGAEAAAKVQSSKLTVGQGQEMLAGREALGNDPHAVRQLGAGEHLADVHLGTQSAAGAAAKSGAKYGGLIAIAVEGGVVLIDPGAHPEALRDIGTAGGLGALGGGTGATAEQLAASALTRRAIAAGAPAAGGVPLTGAAASGSRGLAGAAGGAVGAVFVEWARMAVLEDRPHSLEEGGLRTARAGGIGAVSGAAGAAAGTLATSVVMGTTIGSAVPVLGTAAGFLVGLLVGVALAWALEEALPAVPPSH